MLPATAVDRDGDESTHEGLFAQPTTGGLRPRSVEGVEKAVREEVPCELLGVICPERSDLLEFDGRGHTEAFLHRVGRVGLNGACDLAPGARLLGVSAKFLHARPEEIVDLALGYRQGAELRERGGGAVLDALELADGQQEMVLSVAHGGALS
nr:hypothetical protein [Microbacterium sp. WCS2018Hpa-9]